ncbi:MAG: hypothetical protein ACJ8F7_07030 [Gemmataceae bacterium]
MTEIEEFQAAFPMVFRYTVPIKQHAGSADDLMGTGVLVGIGQKLFVASAGHCIKDDPVVLEENFTIPAGPTRIKILKRGVHPTLDVGFLEIEPLPDVPILQSGGCTLEMLCLQPLTKEHMVHVVGFPAVARRTYENGVEVVKKGFGTLFLREEDASLFLDYPKTGYTWDRSSNSWSTAPFDAHPKGYSGGGVWGFMPVQPKELFSPLRHIRLYGIQFEWFEPERYVKAIAIRHWLSTVGSCCPELQPIINGQFPEVAFGAAVNR